MIEIDLKCLFGNFELILKEKIATDQIVGLFGASGCGKSRLIRQILGYDKNNAIHSNIFFKDQIWQQSEPQVHRATSQRGIGYLPQSIDLFPHLTSEQNILFGWSKRQTKPDDSIIEHVIQQLDIRELLKHYPVQLSGGQQQRVALARAILAAENLLLLDEPFSAIGETHKPKAMQLIRYIADHFSLAVIYSSHDRIEHAYLSKHIITFEKGKVIQSGDYQKISNDISGAFAKEADALNTIEAKVIDFEQENAINCLETKTTRLWAGHKKLVKNSKVVLEIRAKDISISNTAINHSSILNSLAVTVKEFEQVSPHQFLVKLTFEDIYLTAFITKKSLYKLDLKPNQKVYAMFKSIGIHSLPLELVSE